MSELVRFGGGGETAITLAAGIAVALAILLILLLPRKYVVVPFLLAILLIPIGEKIVVGGIHLMMFRVMLFFGGFRLLISLMIPSSNGAKFRMNSIDWAVILWCISSVITFTVLWGEWQALINRIGFVYNTIGGYFIFRFLLHDEEDVDRVTRLFAVICAIVAVCMTVEYLTGRNAFSYFGGVATFSRARDGNIRAQGPFEHPLLAGTFGATLLPLFVGLWWQERKYKGTAILGVISATIMAILCWSSTPLLAYAAGIGALFFWPFRKKLRPLRWGAALSLIALHLVMKAPVWALIARADVVGGSSGYHRYELVNMFIRNFGEWWLLGTKNSGAWGWDMFDTSNQYVETGVTGGLLTLIIFIAIIVYCFKGLGVARANEEAKGNSAAERRLWVLGAALFSTAVAFVGISYFDQTVFLWYCLLAMIAALTFSADAARHAATESDRSFHFAAMGPSNRPALTNARTENRFLRHFPPRV